MTKFLPVCLTVMIVSWVALRAAPATENFTLVERVGEPIWFFVFETSVDKFWIRRDGMGEIGRQSLRDFFYLKPPSKDYIDRLYFLELEDDMVTFDELHIALEIVVPMLPVKPYFMSLLARLKGSAS